jgi:hypothetical protein
MDSDGEDGANLYGEVAPLTSPTSNAQSPPFETSPAPSNWTAAHELAAKEAYDSEMADQYIHDLLRRFAHATPGSFPTTASSVRLHPRSHETTKFQTQHNLIPLTLSAAAGR